MREYKKKCYQNQEPTDPLFSNDFRMTDSKYFTTTKKGELFELRADLVSDRKDKKKDAVKKVTFVSFPTIQPV